MPRQNRSYKKEKGYFRDSFLLIIACEGADAEKEYFEALVKKSRRIKLKILAPHEDDGDHIGRSAPRWVLDRAAKYVQEEGLNERDRLWMVMDKDRWLFDDLNRIALHVKETKGWYLAISNPCFEVWLLLHYQEIDKSKLKACKALKKALKQTTDRGYQLSDLLQHTNVAITRAQQADKDPEHFLPPTMSTRVYQVVDFIQKSF